MAQSTKTIIICMQVAGAKGKKSVKGHCMGTRPRHSQILEFNQNGSKLLEDHKNFSIFLCKAM